MKRILTLLLIFIVLSSFISNDALADDNTTETINGVITEVQMVETESFPEYHLTIRILQGHFKDQLIQKVFTQVQFSQWDFKPKVGQTLVLHITPTSSGFDANIMGLSRQRNLLILFLIFFALLLAFGRKKGILSLVSLIVSGVIIYIFFIPLVLKGYDIMLLTVLTAMAVITISFVIISGFTKKSLASILGTICGIISAVVLSEVFCRVSGITGAISEEVYLLASEGGVDIDFASLFIAGIIIGTIGVVMDVSMSITSLIIELKENSPEMGFSRLVASGLNVGKDMMATMINTLILAYAGASLPLLFVFITRSSSLIYAINTEEVAGEIIRSLCGSVGLILTVPFTSIIASHIINKGNATASPYGKRRNRRSLVR